MSAPSKFVRIVYKSGHVVDFECEDFTCTRYGNGDLTLEWKLIPGKPRPLFIHPEEIESIWQIPYREE